MSLRLNHPMIKVVQLLSRLYLIALFIETSQIANAEIPADQVPIDEKVKGLQSDEELKKLSADISAGKILYQVFRLIDSPPYYLFVSVDERAKEASLLAGTDQYAHKLRVIGSGRRGDEQLSWSVYDAHAQSSYTYQSISFKVKEAKDTSKPSSQELINQGDLTIVCKQMRSGVNREKKRTLKPILASKAQRLLSSLRIYEPIRTTHKPHRLFRDDWGVYYYIEERRSPQDGERFRLWRGYRGAMSLLPVMTAAADSEGIVLISKDAAMRLVSKGGQPSSVESRSGEKFGAYWTQAESAQMNRQQKSLIEIPIDRNQSVIYSDLGIYRGLYLGSPCDPLYHYSPKDLDILNRSKGTLNTPTDP